MTRCDRCYDHEAVFYDQRSVESTDYKTTYFAWGEMLCAECFGVSHEGLLDVGPPGLYQSWSEASERERKASA